MSHFPRSFKAVIFDMDGVIVNSEPLHDQAFKETFDELGYGETHGIRLTDFRGRSDRAVWNVFVERHRPSQSLAELTDLKESRLIRALQADRPIFPGIPQLVESLAAHYPLAVASGSLHRVIRAVLELDDLRRFFGTVVSSEDVASGKPSPDIFLRTADLMGVAPADCCVIEDTTAGIQAGLAAGMTVIAITNTYPAGELTRAHQVVRTYDEISRLLMPRPG